MRDSYPRTEVLSRLPPELRGPLFLYIRHRLSVSDFFSCYTEGEKMSKLKAILAGLVVSDGNGGFYRASEEGQKREFNARLFLAIVSPGQQSPLVTLYPYHKSGVWGERFTVEHRVQVLCGGKVVKTFRNKDKYKALEEANKAYLIEGSRVVVQEHKKSNVLQVELGYSPPAPGLFSTAASVIKLLWKDIPPLTQHSEQELLSLFGPVHSDIKGTWYTGQHQDPYQYLPECIQDPTTVSHYQQQLIRGKFKYRETDAAEIALITEYDKSNSAYQGVSLVIQD